MIGRVFACSDTFFRVSKQYGGSLIDYVHTAEDIRVSEISFSSASAKVKVLPLAAFSKGWTKALAS